MNFASLVAQLCNFNRSCLLCSHASSELICRHCADDIPCYDLESVNSNLLNNVKVAAELKHSAFDELVALGEYNWPLSKMITQLKFSNKQCHAKALAKLFCQKALPTMGQSPDLLIPIPLHPSRLASRKYNQAALIAKEISRIIQVPVQFDALRRTRNTAAQTELTTDKRAENIRNAFSVQQIINVERVAIIDDVVTTGATVSAASKAISAIYPDVQVDVWAICLTPEHQ